MIAKTVVLMMGEAASVHFQLDADQKIIFVGYSYDSNGFCVIDEISKGRSPDFLINCHINGGWQLCRVRVLEEG